MLTATTVVMKNSGSISSTGVSHMARPMPAVADTR